MRKVYKLKDLDCANCAAKMETAIKKIDGVQSATVNFLSQKLTVEADEAVFEDVLKKIAKAIKKIEPDCKIVF
ncbi:MAG: cation transporter [Clostridia bacterium]|nr:cation transporter [Oscillospiraceae bacterium]MDD6219882.1 cation transporter [Clostridia bacterium]